MSDSSFSPEEKICLSPFFTNMERDIFGLKLPQEVAGALFSRYSRSNKDLRRVFLDEFIGDMGWKSDGHQASDGDALNKARAFYDRVLVGYGDDSVAQLGGAHIACEGISNLAAKIIEDSRIGLSPLEKSTRYVRFDKKDKDGFFPYYREPRILASPHASDFIRVMDLLFSTYSRQIDPMIEFFRHRMPLESMSLKHPQTGEELQYKRIEGDPVLRKWAESAYRSTLRAQACDVLRSYLPSATKTNVGLFGVGQAFEYLMTKLYSNPLSEMRSLAEGMHEELNAIIPSFVKRARNSPYLQETLEGTARLAEQMISGDGPISNDSVTLLDFEPEAEERVLSAILYPHTRLSLSQLRVLIKGWGPEPRMRLLDEYLSRRRHRRDKPGRALEQVYYTFDLLGNIGMYRDLHRHRILSQERQDFTVAHGYETPGELKEIGFLDEFKECMERSAELYSLLIADFPREAQYVVPFAYRIRWYMKMNLRELVHLSELRTMPQGHPDYRTMVQDMCRKVESIHPSLFRYAKFVDWGEYRMGRLQSEIRTEYKRSGLT